MYTFISPEVERQPVGSSKIGAQWTEHQGRQTPGTQPSPVLDSHHTANTSTSIRLSIRDPEEILKNILYITIHIAVNVQPCARLLRIWRLGNTELHYRNQREVHIQISWHSSDSAYIRSKQFLKQTGMENSREFLLACRV